MDETTSVATKPPIASDNACANCGHTPVGRYCPACGQRQLSRAQFSLRHLAGELGANLLQWDNKLLRTLVLALAKPGELSALYLAGARSRYTSPITLLLLLFFFFFVGSVPLTDFTQPLQAHLEWGKWYSAPFADWLQAKAAATSGGMPALALAFGQQQHELAKTLVLLHVPLFAIGLKLLHVRRDVYYVEHVIVASHFLVAVLLTTLLAVLLLFLPVESLYAPAEVPEPVKRQVLLWGLNLPMAAVLLLTLKRAYRQSWWLALLKLPLAILAFAAAHMLYRALTFGATLLLL
ncbi:MAG TPA: DUF3667 domain-containing protein [Permianibacter sp.]|nr:DUF3667 domain-containing protein [Permianibacter sp.]